MLTRILPRLYAALGVGRWLQNPVLERAYLTAFFAYKRFAEDPFAKLVARHPELFRSGSILDAGANVGYTATVFAGVVEPPHRVYAFEPEPVNLRRLHRVVESRGLNDRIVIEAMAVGERTGEADLVVNPSHPGDHRIGRGPSAESIRVPIVSLDEYVDAKGIAQVSFVKIDVQGFELAVSRGMERLLSRAPHLSVAFEYSEETAHAYGYSGADLLRFYTDRGFQLHLLTRSAGLAPATAEAIAQWEATHGYTDVLAVREALQR
jgi:FkbM family methyltransferase